MTLIKLDGKIISITGRVGGTVFKRDGSGQHATALARRAASMPSNGQKEQQNWYGQKKYCERHGPLPGPRDLHPPTPPGVAISSVDAIHWEELASEDEPSMEVVWVEASVEDIFRIYVNTNWHWISTIPGITPELAFKLLCKWYWELTRAHGIPQVGALHRVFQHMDNLAFFIEPAFVESLIALAQLVIVITIGAVIGHLLYKATQGHSFVTGEGIIRIGNDIYWARLIRRPSQHMGDFMLGPPIFLPGVSHDIHEVFPLTKANTFNYNLLYDHVLYRNGQWFVIYDSKIVTEFVGDGYWIKDGVYRARLSETQWNRYGVPVGWTYPYENPFGFVDHIYDPTEPPPP